MIADLIRHIEFEKADGNYRAAFESLVDFTENFSDNEQYRREAVKILGAFRLTENAKSNRDITFEEFARSCEKYSNASWKLIDLVKEEYFKKNTLNQSWKIQPGDIALTPKVLFKGDNITKKFGKNFVLEPLSIELKSGQVTALIGKNGSGKSTLLNIIACQFLPDAGEVHYPEFEFFQHSWHSVKNKIAYFSHQIKPWAGTLQTYLSYVLSVNGIHGRENADKVASVLERLDLKDKANRSFSELSAGFQMRAVLAEILATRPPLIILDEPLANQDVIAQSRILEDLKSVANSVRYPSSVIISSQHLFEVESIADQILLLDEGKLHKIENISGRITCELTCFQKRTEIEIILQKGGVHDFRVERYGSTFIIDMPSAYLPKNILGILIENNIEIQYFRDITKSAKKYFIDKTLYRYD